MYSLARRLVVAMVATEMLLTAAITVTTLWYERAQRYQALDVMLRGRADSVLGAVEDSGDEADNVILDRRAIEVPGSDLYEVHERTGKPLGHSPNWTEPLDRSCHEPNHARTVRIQNAKYRALCFGAVRVVDPDGPGPLEGKAHAVIISYATPLWPMHAALLRTARFLLLANSLVLLLTAALATAFVRRGIAPLEALAAEASRVSSRSWSFRPPVEARRVRELQTLILALQTVLSGLERSFLQQQQFVSDAAHELKTAVTIVKSSLQLMNFRERTATEYRAAVEATLRDCARLEELVHKMLALASIEDTQSSAETPRTPVMYPILPAFATAVAGLRPVAELRGVHLRAVFPVGVESELHATMAPEDAITLLENLLSNAIDHSPAGATVEVTLSYGESGRLQLAVRDHGEGISKEHLPFLFDRFYRGDPSRSRRSGGAGLGLAICKALVDAQRGDIRIDSVAGEGTTVTVELPAAVVPSVSPLTALSS